MAMAIRQLAVQGFDDNFSYLVHDPDSGEAALIDPCGKAATIRAALGELRNLRPRYVLFTHGHRDHHDAWPELQAVFPAPTAAHPASCLQPDLPLADHQRLPLGQTWLECLYAPGHTADSVLYRLEDQALFTGDTLFVDWCGFGTPATMFRTMREVIFPLPDLLEIYPGHDYGQVPHAPLGVEKTRNPYLAATTLAEFQQRYKEL